MPESNFNIDKEWEIYYPKVYGYFYKRVNNRLDVEDLTSMVLTSFFETMMDIEKSKRVKNKHGYLWKIAHNQLVMFIQKKTKNPITVGLEDEFDGQDVDPSIEKSRSQHYTERINDLMDCVRRALPRLDYQIINLSFIEEKKSPEIAEELHLNAANVRQRLKRALDKLRTQCKQLWFE